MTVKEVTPMDLKHISERPWSDYNESDYSLEQWHRACLIHLHEGVPTSKAQCKLPVRTPDGALNRNGVYAAAAALAGARTELQAPQSEKDKAAKALIRFYGEMNKEPPPSLLGHSNVINIIEHVGVRGMRWGVKKAPISKKEQNIRLKRQKISENRRQLSDQDLRKYIDRLSNEKKLKTLVDEDLKPSKTIAKRILSESGQKVLRTVASGALLYAVKAVVEKKFEPKEAVKWITPKPKHG